MSYCAQHHYDHYRLKHKIDTTSQAQNGLEALTGMSRVACIGCTTTPACSGCAKPTQNNLLMCGTCGTLQAEAARHTQAACSPQRLWDPAFCPENSAQPAAN